MYWENFRWSWYNQKEIEELHDDLLFSMAYAHDAEITRLVRPHFVFYRNW